MKTDLSSHIKLEHVSKRYYKPESEMELISLTRYEKVATNVVETPSEGAVWAAQEVADTIEQCLREKGRCVMGLGAGRCAMDVYGELVKMYFADKVSFNNVVVFNMTELGLGVPGDDESQSTKIARSFIFGKVNNAKKPGLALSPGRYSIRIAHVCFHSSMRLFLISNPVCSLFSDLYFTPVSAVRCRRRLH